MRIKFEVCYNQIFLFSWNYAMCNFYKESNAHFSYRWFSLMLFMTSYLATIATLHHQIWTESALGIKWAVTGKKRLWLKIRFWKYWAKPGRLYQFNWCLNSKSSISFLFLICFDREEQIKNKKEIRIKKERNRREKIGL